MKENEQGWLSEVNAQSLQASLINLEKAFIRFFKHKNGFPNFKKKCNQQSFQIPQRGYVDDKLYIPKFPEGIKINLSREFKGETKTFTIKKTTTNKYFVSILVDDGKYLPNKKPIKEKTTIGIDVGIKDFCVLSNGERIENPKHLRNNLLKLKVLQRRASKKTKGSNNRKKANLKVALFHEKIKNRRKDFLHKLSSKLIRENQSIAIEDLNIKGMIQNHKLAQSISDVSWSEFFRQLEYKSDWYGKNLIKIGRFDASSKTCSCGEVNNELILSDREWTCKVCGLIHDRDLLASQNIKHFALLKDNLDRAGYAQSVSGDVING